MPRPSLGTRSTEFVIGHWAFVILSSFVIGHSSFPPVAAEPTQPPRFSLHSAADAVPVGPLDQLEADWSVTLAGSGRVPGAELVALRRADRPLPPLPTGAHVVFANGDRLPGQLLSADRTTAKVRAEFGDRPVLEVPLAALAVLWLDAPPRDAAAATRRWLAERRRRDVVLLRNGDALQGTLRGLAENGPLRLDDHGTEIAVERAKVAAVALNTDLARTLRPKGAYGRLVLADGSRLGLAAATADGRILTGTTLFAAEVKVPLAQVAALDVRQGKAVYLSDLKPRRYEENPYNGHRWGYVADGSVERRELTLAGGTYDKGLGMHSESRITYALDGTYRRFEALVGLDDRDGRRGSVAVKVLVDGKPRDVGPPALTAAAAPRPLRVDVAGARELTLVVEFGAGGPAFDCVNWADARLIR